MLSSVTLYCLVTMIALIAKNVRIVKFVKIVRNGQNSQKLSNCQTFSDIFKHCQTFSKLSRNVKVVKRKHGKNLLTLSTIAKIVERYQNCQQRQQQM